MTCPFDHLLRSGAHEELAELYEMVAETVCDTEDIEYEHGEYPVDSHAARLISAFNACEAKAAEQHGAVDRYQDDNDTAPAELDTKAGNR